MGKSLLTAEEIKNNAKLRKLIRAFLENDKEIPEEVFDYLRDNLDDCKLLAPVDITEENLKKFESDEEDVSFAVDMKLIEDEDGRTWIPLFTSKETSEDGDGEGENVTLLPFLLVDVMDQLDGDADGVVIDPWTNGFPITKEIMDNVIIDDDDTVGINLVKGNIEDLNCDAIVNSANNTLIPGAGGVDKDIHDAAGKGLAAECRTLHGCGTGEAKITDAYDLECDYVIHTVGPIYSGKQKDEDDLANCYESCLYLAREHGLHSVAFPCISTGYFGFPKEDACDIAIQTTLSWLADNDDYQMGITFCCQDEENYDIYQNYLDEELGEEE